MGTMLEKLIDSKYKNRKLFCSNIGISESVLSQALKKNRGLSYDSIKKIATGLDVPITHVEYLISNDEEAYISVDLFQKMSNIPKNKILEAIRDRTIVNIVKKYTKDHGFLFYVSVSEALNFSKSFLQENTFNQNLLDMKTEAMHGEKTALDQVICKPNINLNNNQSNNQSNNQRSQNIPKDSISEEIDLLYSKFNQNL